MPLSTSICHDRSCRRAAGAESVARAVVPDDAFELIEGNPVAFNPSEGVTRRFCGHCGTTPTCRDGPGTIDDMLASLDDPERLPPVKEIRLEHRLSWNPARADLPGYPRGSGTGNPAA